MSKNWLYFNICVDTRYMHEVILFVQYFRTKPGFLYIFYLVEKENMKIMNFQVGPVKQFIKKPPY